MPPNDNKIEKSLDRIVKLQQDQDKARQEEYTLLREHLARMNILLSDLIKIGESGSTVAATKKTVPFQTGSQAVGQLVTKPANPDGYPTIIDVYSINNSRIIPHMTLVNDGPGDLFFINAYAKNVFNENEGHLNVNDQRELFNVYEVRLRSTLPLTTFRLIEGIFRTGSFAPNTKANVEIRPTVQANELLKEFDALFDIVDPTINITSPTTQNLPANFSYPSFQPPLPPGHTAAFVDASTGIPMPFTIPEGFIAEGITSFANLSTDFTFRNWGELIPGSGIFTLFTTLPISNRGAPFNIQISLAVFSTAGLDPLGAPAPGRKSLFTITNDDPFNNMIGDIDILVILRRII